MRKPLLLLLIGISLVTVNPRINGWNEASRMALTQSLVEQGSFIIDNSEFAETGDRVYINDHFYSDKPPIPSLLAALVYLPIYHLGGQLSYGWNLAYYLIILLTVKLWWLLSVLAFAQILMLRGLTGQKYLRIVLLFAFTSIAFSWSATFNNHSLAASWLTIAFLYYLNWKNTGNIFHAAISGLFFGLSGSADVPTGLFLIGFALLVFHKSGFSKSLLAYLALGFIPLLTYGVLNYTISGSLLPVQIVGDNFAYEGSVWGQGLQVNSLVASIKYAFLSLIGMKGFIWYNPLLILIIPAMILHIRQKSSFWMEGVIIGISSMILVIYYSIYTQNYGGWTYSIRWFVPLLPLLYFYLYDLLEFTAGNAMRRALNYLVSISILISVIGLVNPWSNPAYHSVPFIANIKQLLDFIL
ncbi:MAG: hypothetical protein K9N38_07385 [Candidatus Marinimicrobia bacterium]|nr:hypothetical protein [Candidatus Neomarinimicrobiota bacterium]